MEKENHLGNDRHNQKLYVATSHVLSTHMMEEITALEFLTTNLLLTSSTNCRTSRYQIHTLQIQLMPKLLSSNLNLCNLDFGL